MFVTINLPEKIEHRLREQWGDLPRRALEALALEGYRSGALSAGQVAEVLQLSVWEAEFLLHELGAELDYSAEDLERDMAESERVPARAYQKAADLGADDAEVLLSLGRCHALLGDHAGAAEWQARALVTDLRARHAH